MGADHFPEGRPRSGDQAQARRTGIRDEGAPPWLVRTGSVATRLLVVAVLVWLLAELVQKITLLVVALLVALLLAGVVTPVLQWTDRHRIPRRASALVAVLLFLGLVVGAGALVGQRVADQVPELQEQLESLSTDLSQTFGVELPLPGSGSGSGSGSDGGSGSQEVVGGLLSSFGVVADVLVGFFLTLVFTYLFLVAGARMWNAALGLLGGRLRQDVDAAGRAAWATVGAYVRGLTVVAAVDAVGIGVGLLVLGVPLALTLALLQFIASYVPTIGSIVAGAVAVAIAYVSGGLTTALLALAIILVVQQVGNDVIEPWVMERHLPMNAMTVLVAVTAGGLLWGIAGALLFVPLTAAASAAARELWQRHGRPPLFGRERDQDPTDAATP